MDKFDINKVYVADCLKRDYNNVYEQIYKAVDGNLGVIPGCNDYWVRDFMPVSLGNGKLLRFRYHPDYLEGDRQYETDQRAALYGFGIPEDSLVPLEVSKKDEKIMLILDGGNVVRCGDKIVLTKKVFRDNYKYNDLERKETEQALKSVFGEGNLIFLPWDYIYEDYGHSDGMIAYNEVKNTVILSDSYWNEDSDGENPFYNHCEGILGKAGLAVTKFSIIGHTKNDWAYLNILKYKDKVLVPQLGKDGAPYNGDEEAIEFYQNEFEGKTIEPIYMPRKLLNYGGALHCCTWSAQ